MKVSDLFNELRKIKDSNGYSGALSTKDVKAHDTDTDDTYEISGVIFDPENNCFFLTLLLEEQP